VFTCGNHTIDIDEVLRNAEIAFDFYTDSLKFIRRQMNKRSKNVKFLFTAYMIFSAYFLIMATSPSEPSLMILLGTAFVFSFRRLCTM